MRRRKECPKCGAEAILEDADYDPIEDGFYRIFRCGRGHEHYEFFNGDKQGGDAASETEGEEDGGRGDRLEVTRRLNTLLDRLGVEPDEED